MVRKKIRKNLTVCSGDGTTMFVKQRITALENE